MRKVQRTFLGDEKVQTKAELYLEPTERFALPKQAFDPFGLYREGDVCIPAGLFVLLQPFVTQGTVPKQPETKRGGARSGSSAAGAPSRLKQDASLT